MKKKRNETQKKKKKTNFGYNHVSTDRILNPLHLKRTVYNMVSPASASEKLPRCLFDELFYDVDAVYPSIRVYIEAAIPPNPKSITRKMLMDVDANAGKLVRLFLVICRIADDPTLYARVVLQSEEPMDPKLHYRLQVYHTWLCINYHSLLCSTFCKDNSTAIMATFVEKVTMGWLSYDTPALLQQCKYHAAIIDDAKWPCYDQALIEGLIVPCDK